MRSIFLFIPHYVYTSDLLHTDYIKYLSEKYKVIVFSPAIETNPSYLQSPNVDYIRMDAQCPNFWLKFDKTFRFSLVKEFDHFEYHKLREKTALNLNAKRRFLKFCSRFLPRYFTTIDFFTWLETILYPKNKFTLLEKYVSKYQPSLFITATPGLSDLEAEAIIFGKLNSIKTVAINFSWDNLINHAKQIRKPDYLIVWNEVVKKYATEIHGYPENKVFISGILRFDDHFNKKRESSKEDFFKNKKLDPSLKTILFATVPPQIYPFQQEFLRELIEIRKRGILKEDFNIFVRLHPRDDIQYYKEFLHGREKNLSIEMAGQSKKQLPGTLQKIEMNNEDLYNLKNTLKYSNLAINFRSSITLETCLYNLPTINLAYHGYELYYQMDHYIPLLKNGCVKLVKDEREFIQTAASYLKNPKLDSEKRKKIAKEYVPFQDGLSYKRNVDILEKIVND